MTNHIHTSALATQRRGEKYIDEVKAKIADLTIRVNSEGKYSRLSNIESGVKAEHILYFDEAIEQLNKSKNTIALYKNFIDQTTIATEGLVRQIEDGSHAIANMVSNIMNGREGSLALLDQCRAILENLEHSLNSNISGSYIFAGSRSNVAPVHNLWQSKVIVDDKITATNYFRGDKQALQLHIDGKSSPYSITADHPVIAEFIAAVQTLVSAKREDGTYDVHTAERAMIMADGAGQNAASLLVNIGRSTRALDTALANRDEEIIVLKEAQERINGANETDLAKIVLDLQKFNDQLSVLYYITGSIGKVRLVDFL